MTVTQRGMETALARYIFGWVESRQKTLKEVAQDAGVPHSTFTFIKHGRIPRPNTLMKLAKAMGVPSRTLLELAGYVSAADLEPEELTEEQRDVLSLWAAIPEEHRELMRGILQQATQKGSRLGTLRQVSQQSS